MANKENETTPREQKETEEQIERRKKARCLLGRTFRVVLVIMKIYKAAVSTSELIRKHQTSNIGEILSAEEKERQLREQGSSGVQVFDVSKFKSYGKVTELSERCRQAMRTPFLLRTTQDIKEIVRGLKQITQFLEFPEDILSKIASRIWVEWFPAHRVIVRQGHRGENYYVILSGRIEVSVIEVNPVDKEIRPRTVNVLGKGQAFGEKALLGDVKRNATCVSLDRVELLVLAKDAFIQIVSMRSDLDNRNPDQEPEHIKFLRRVPFLKFFPLSVLCEDFESCQFYYYRRGMLICPDINTTQHVYVIKTGSCSVIMEMEKCRYSISRDQVEYEGPTVQQILALSRPKLALTPSGSRNAQTCSCSSGSNASRGGVFIRVNALLPGDEFGLNTLNKQQNNPGALDLSPPDDLDREYQSDYAPSSPSSPRLSLVSNGCECISISKEVLLRYSSTLVVKQMKECMTQYPDSQVLRLRLKNTQKWQNYRKAVINQCVDQKLQRIFHKRSVTFN